VASDSSSLASGFPIDVSYFSVCISEGSSAMIDNAVLSECAKISYLQQQQNTFFRPIPYSTRFIPHPQSKILLRPVLKMKRRLLCIRVSCQFVCILLGLFCDHCKNVW